MNWSEEIRFVPFALAINIFFNLVCPLTKKGKRVKIKEREQNKCRFLRGYLVLIFYFENAHYININRTFKAKTKNKTSLARICIYLIRVPKGEKRFCKNRFSPLTPCSRCRRQRALCFLKLENLRFSRFWKLIEI